MHHFPVAGNGTLATLSTVNADSHGSCTVNATLADRGPANVQLSGQNSDTAVARERVPGNATTASDQAA